MTTPATRFEFTEDGQFSFGIHDVSEAPPDRIGEAYSEAHARLLAAAPEMLAALHQAFLSLECRPHAQRVTAIVAAAIAKAEGRS